ncbi:molybdopterin-dependent oxidoreductase [bacterium]|nr:molybdopterin-dependent oxidoreductase [bacterium]
MEPVSFRLNGQIVSSHLKADTRLLDVLRVEFGLTGAKEGCGTGACGSCSVLIDGRAANACQVRLAEMVGHDLVTIEGLMGSSPLIASIQAALKQTSAPQCGFCTPAMIIRMFALLSQQSRPTRQEVIHALKPVLCRCTGYEQYIRATLLAAGLVEAEQIDDDLALIGPGPATIQADQIAHVQIGRSAVRNRIAELMSGKALFTDDYAHQDLIYGALVTSPYPSASIRSIDTGRLDGLPGFIRVLTARDVPGKNSYGKVIRDREMLCRERVRMVGDPVVLVLAETEQQARDLAALVRVDYECFEPVLTVEQALAEGAPAVHASGNVLSVQNIIKGDPDAFFNGDYPVCTGDYRTGRTEQCPLELESTLAYWDRDILTIVAPTQHVFFDRLNISRVLGLSAEQVRVVQPHVGGAFGKREDLHTQLFAALACYLTHKAVKVRFTRQESFALTTKRHPFLIAIKTAYDPHSGKILAQDVTLTADGGAYASWSPNIIRKAAVHCCGPYEIEHVRVNARVVYTNNPVSGAMRGFGVPQVAFAMESHIDRLAELCGLTPAEIRARNYLHKGSSTITGQRLLFDVPVQATLTNTVQKAMQLVHEEPVRGAPSTSTDRIYYGTGLASCCYGIGFGAGIRDVGKATIRFTREGRFELKTGVVDYGQGAQTIACQIAAEVLGVPLASIIITAADTHSTPNSGSSVASRQTFITGNAILRAAQDLKLKICQLVGQHLGVQPETLYFDDEGLVSPTNALRMSYSEIQTIAWQNKVELLGLGEFRGHDYTSGLDPSSGQGDAYYPFTYGTQWTRVAVNARTGEVRVLDMIACHYIGKALNPRMVKGQIYGAIAMGIGYALMEQITVEQGAIKQRRLGDYHLVRAHDMPAIQIILLEDDSFPGPFGAVGIGEPPLVPTAPAIANAVFAATGYRATSLPITAETIQQHIQEQGRQS